MKTKFLLPLLLLSIAEFAMASESADDLTGREIADMGQKISIEGTTFIEEGELYLEYKNSVYQIHIGPEEYSDEIGFSKEGGQFISLTGFVADGNVTPEVIRLDGKDYMFRDSDGNPMWRGQSYTDRKGLSRYESGNWLHDDHEDH